MEISPKNHRLIKRKELLFGNSWDMPTPLSSNQLHPNYAELVLLKSIGFPAGVVLEKPYQGLIVIVPDDPSVANQGVFVNRIWNDYRMIHHAQTNALFPEINAPKLSHHQKETYFNKIALLASKFTWASQAFLYLVQTQLNIHINETDFAVTRRKSIP